MSVEEAIYHCTWSETPDGFAVWVKSRPHVRAEGATFVEADERLVETIYDSGEAMHVVFEYDPQPPRSKLEAKYSDPNLVLISGDDTFLTDAPVRIPFETDEERESRFKWFDEFFQSPVCRKCGHPSSPRSDRPLYLVDPPTYDGGFGYVGSDASATLYLFSDRFLDLLTESERTGLHFRPVTGKAGATRHHELAGPAGPPEVAVAGLKISGWRCTECGFRIFGYWCEGIAMTTFIAKADLPPNLPGVFTVGAPPNLHLAATASRWQELVGKKGTRDVLSNPLGVVPEHEVIRNPEVPARE